GHVIGRVAAGTNLRLLLHELHVAPRRVAEGERVVVRESAPSEPVVGDLIPLLARDFARLAADAERGVGEEAGGPGHVEVPGPASRVPVVSTRDPGPGTLLTLQLRPFDSKIRTFGSSEIASRSLTTSPLTSP